VPFPLLHENLTTTSRTPGTSRLTSKGSVMLDSTQSSVGSSPNPAATRSHRPSTHSGV
jgi:hypothetical protein